VTIPHVLIAEDDVRFRETLVLEFRDLGFCVEQIGTLDEIDGFSPGIFTHALIDLRLGNTNGLQLVEKMLSREPLCRIVILTGYGSIATAVKAVKLGAVDYLTKPVCFNEIRRALFGLSEPSKEFLPKKEDGLSLARLEREYIESVLARCEGNVSQAARILGLHRQSLQRKLRKFTPV
jgi:two-component system response regulator RegA